MHAPEQAKGRTGQLLNAAAAAVIALSGALLPAAEAQAGVVYSGVQNLQIPVTTSGLYLNLVTGVSSNGPSGAPGWDVNLWGTSTLFTWANNVASPGSGAVSSLGTFATLVDNLALGTTIDGSLGYGSTNNIETSGATAFLVNSAANYVGFKFLNEGTGQMDFGWVQVQIGGTYNNSQRFIVGWAYEDSGAAINVGDTGAAVGTVPEPASMALAALALAGCAVAGSRRKRPQGAQQTAA